MKINTFWHFFVYPVQFLTVKMTLLFSESELIYRRRKTLNGGLFVKYFSSAFNSKVIFGTWVCNFKSYFSIASIKHQKHLVLLEIYDKRLEKAVNRRLFAIKQPLQNRVPRVRSLLPLPRENGLNLWVWAVFLMLFLIGTWSAFPHFDAQIGHQFRICCRPFVTIPSGTSSKKHRSAAANGLVFPLYLCLHRIKFWPPEFSLRRSFYLYFKPFSYSAQSWRILFHIVKLCYLRGAMSKQIRHLPWR